MRNNRVARWGTFAGILAIVALSVLPGTVARAAVGDITTVAGTGASAFSGDGGAATSAGLVPYGVAADAAGNLFIADLNRIRKVAAGTGVIATVAGTGATGSSGDGGPATSAGLNFPFAVALDAAGNLFIADFSNHRVRRVAAATGVITTVAGTGTQGFSGDGGAATSAALTRPSGVAVDAAGNLFIADSGNQRIRKVAAGTGVIATVAGTGAAGFSGDGGPATSAGLAGPHDVGVDAGGNLFIAEFGSFRVRKVAAATGVITTVAGTGTFGFSGDGGPATSANLSYPQGVAVDAAGNLFIADASNSRVRKVQGVAQAVVVITVNETYGIADSTQVLPPVVINITVNETYGITDSTQILLPVVITVNESYGITDSSQVLLPVAITVNESYGITDSIQVTPGAQAPPSAGTTVSGTVTLQGRTATFPTGVGHGIARVTLSPGGITVNVNADGSFQFPNVGAGTFTLTASAAGYVLRERTSVVVAASPVSVPSVQLRCGLVNSDNFVNINDITATVASFGTSPADRVDAQGRFVDQNGDGFVNINDITCVVSSFGTTSPQVWP